MTAPSQPDRPADDLEQLAGISASWASALRRIGIHSSADLASLTPEQLAAELGARLGMKISPRTIKAKNWIGQARQRTTAAGEHSAPSESPRGQRVPHRRNNWREHASFSIFFGLAPSAGGEAWQTRVYHGESGDEAELEGTDPTTWLSWILARAKLPAPGASQPPQASANHAEPPAPPAPAPSQLLVSIDTPEPNGSQPVAQLHLRLDGTGGDQAGEAQLCCLELRIVGPGQPGARLLSFKYYRLAAGQTDHSFAQPLPALEPGNYQLRALARLAPHGATLGLASALFSIR